MPVPGPPGPHPSAAANRRQEQVSPRFTRPWQAIKVEQILNEGMEKARVLVVEDDPLVSEIIAVALDDAYATTVVGTATDALECLRTGGIRLMLLDCTLPGGLDADLIPEADRLGATVVLMSGDRARIDTLVGGSRPFVLKPFTVAGLLETVEHALCDAI